MLAKEEMFPGVLVSAKTLVDYSHYKLNRLVENKGETKSKNSLGANATNAVPERLVFPKPINM